MKNENLILIMEPSTQNTADRYILITIMIMIMIFSDTW